MTMTKTLPASTQVRIQWRIDGQLGEKNWSFATIQKRGIGAPPLNYCYTIYHAGRVWIWTDYKFSASVGPGRIDEWVEVSTWDEAGKIILENY